MKSSLIAVSVAGQETSRLFFVTDKNTDHRFLVDTGAEVSVLPPPFADCRATVWRVQVASSEWIPYYDLRSALPCPKCRLSSSVFVAVCSCRCGASDHWGKFFFWYFGLDFSVRRRCIIDTSMKLNTHSVSSFLQSTGLPTLLLASPYESIFPNFPGTIKPVYHGRLARSFRKHHIVRKTKRR